VGILLLGLCNDIWRITYLGIAFVIPIKISKGGTVAGRAEFIVEKVGADIFVFVDELINAPGPGNGG